MVFASLEFIYFFLPAFLVVYLLTPKKYRNFVLLVFSLLFYAVGEPIYILLLLFSSLVDYTHALLIERYQNQPKAKLFLMSSIVINLGMLGLFKYLDFFIDGINLLLQTSIELKELPLPIGISFFTFQTMSYSIDVYRGHIKAQRSLLNFATYVTLFPQLIAGPIVRYSEVESELVERRITVSAFSKGIRRFVKGLAKKVLIADSIGLIACAVSQMEEPSVVSLWLFVILFALQIYYDFSGYSDMAIGLGLMIGFTFPENFNYPYIARSITDFWRRWHMTLSRWFKDYLYIPLGGNRGSIWKWLRNILIVWAVTGLWHGASFNFVFWGLYFGFFLSIEKLGVLKLLQKMPRVLQHFYTLLIVLCGWVLFQVEGLQEAQKMFQGLFGFGSIDFINAGTWFYIRQVIVLLVVAVIGATPLLENIKKKVMKREIGFFIVMQIVILLILSTAYLINQNFHPFLYFRF